MRLILLLLLTTPAFAQTIVLKAARMIDGTGAAPVANAVVIIEGDTITAAGSNLAIPAKAKVIDLGSATLLPGFIDAHTHLIGRPLGEPGWDDENVRDLEGYGAIRGVENAGKTLMHGITTVRNVGASYYNDVALRLYEKFGFEIEGLLRRYAFRDGSYVDAYTLARLR